MKREDLNFKFLSVFILYDFIKVHLVVIALTNITSCYLNVGKFCGW